MNIYNTMQFSGDECYTSKAEANKLVAYLIKNNLVNKNLIIWLPFDNELSNIYKSLKENGFKTTLSNLELGLDFYLYEPEVWDLIITNPPFSKRTQLMARLLSFEKPFIILQATQFFNNHTAVNLLCENSYDFKFLMPESRMSFLTYDKNLNKVRSNKRGIAFYSFWLCYKIALPQTFNSLASCGQEKNVEEYDVFGNVIQDSHLTLFNFLNKEEADETC